MLGTSVKALSEKKDETRLPYQEDQSDYGQGAGDGGDGIEDERGQDPLFLVRRCC